MKKSHAEYRTDKELAAEVAELAKNLDAEYKEQSKERDDWFNDPANAEEAAELFARMDLVEAMYKARHEAGLTQREMAEMLGTTQSYISMLEKGKKNITFSTLARYAAVCGKKVAVTLL